MALPAPTPTPHFGSTLGFQAPPGRSKASPSSQKHCPGTPGWVRSPSDSPPPRALKPLGSALQSVLGGGSLTKGVQGRFYSSMKGALSVCLSLGSHLTYTVSCLSLCLRDSPSMLVCVGPSQLLPTSVPPPHPHPFVCHRDSTLVTTGTKAGQQVCEGVGEGDARLCGTSPPHLHLTLIFFGIPLPFPRRAATLNSRGSSGLCSASVSLFLGGRFWGSLPPLSAPLCL